jgi:hypothetical protein
MVLLDQGRREYDVAQALAAGRKLGVVQPLCAFNPLHERASGRPTGVSPGPDGAVPELGVRAYLRVLPDPASRRPDLLSSH